MLKDQGVYLYVFLFERSVSVGVILDFFDFDIDQLIVELIIFLFFFLEEDIGQVDYLVYTWSGLENKEFNEEFNLEAFEVDLEALVIFFFFGEVFVLLD